MHRKSKQDTSENQQKNNVIVIATGASLTADDCAIAEKKADIIAIKEAYRLLPNASFIYGCDADFWDSEQEVYAHSAKKYTQCKKTADKYGLEWVHCWQNEQKAIREGVIAPAPHDKHKFSFNPAYICSGYNSGFQAINLAILLGYNRIGLLGFDMGITQGGDTHFFGKRDIGRNVNSPYALFAKTLDNNADWLKQNNIEVINCSRMSALSAYERRVIDDF